MPTANIKHRDTIERIYPLEAFACDAARNGQVTNQIVHGVRILSAPNVAGDFELERASQQVGEAASAAFLAPHRCDERLINAGRDSPTSEATRPDPREGYAAFLAEIITAAQQFGFEPEKSPGRAEPRLQGLRQ